VLETGSYLSKAHFISFQWVVSFQQLLGIPPRWLPPQEIYRDLKMDIEATGYQHMWVRRFISGANLVPVPKIPEAGRLATKNGGAAP
jgi:hypothetical protein